ncbi:MAG: tetratricopeptide repeat protein [Planctomycetota bacterium]
MNRLTPWKIIPAAALIAGAVFFCYFMTVDADFVYDDPILILDNPLVSNPAANFMDIFFQPYFGTNSGFYRPLMTLLFRVEFYLYKGQAFGFHLDNLLIHAGACLALFGLLLLLLVPLPRALAAGLLLAVHPVATEPVAWISGRTDPLSFLFMGMSVIFLVLFFRSPASRGRSGLGTAAIACFLIALLVKESALVLLVPAGILIRMLSRENTGGHAQAGREPADHSQADGKDADHSRAERGSGALYLGGAYLGVAIFTFIVGRVLQGGDEVELFCGRGNLFERGLTFLSLLPDYMQKLFVPVHQDIARPVHLVTSLQNLGVWLGAGILIVAFAAMIFGIRRKKAALAAGAGLFLFSLLSVSNLVPIPYGMREMDFPFFERYLYIPLAGLLVALASVGVKERAWIRNSLPLAAVLCLCPFLTERVKQRNLDWHDNVSLFRAAVQSFPESPSMSFNLGQALSDAGDYRGAQAAFYQASLLDPELAMARVQGAVAAAGMGQMDRAVAELDAILKEDPKNGQAQEALGFIYAGAKQWLPAFESYSRSLPLLGHNPTTRRSRDTVAAKIKEEMETLYLEKKAYREVLDLADRVLAWLPGCAWAHEAKGLALLELGNEAGAVKSLEAALATAGAPPMRAMEKLIPIYERTGREAEAKYLQEQIKMINEIISSSESPGK